jgi:hypothetical protein
MTMEYLEKLSTGTRIALGCAIAFLVVSFFNWQEIELGEFGSAGVSMWHGVGVVAGLLAIGLIVWEAILLANIKFEIGVAPTMISAALGILLLLFTVIKFFADSEFRTFFAWLGLALAIGVTAGAVMAMRAAGAMATLPGGWGGGASTPEAAPPAPPAPPTAPEPPAPPAAPTPPAEPVAEAAPAMEEAAPAADASSEGGDTGEGEAGR